MPAPVGSGDRTRRPGSSLGIPLCGPKRELCPRYAGRITGGAPRARPPERSGDDGAPRAKAWGVRGGEAPGEAPRIYFEGASFVTYRAICSPVANQTPGFDFM